MSYSIAYTLVVATIVVGVGALVAAVWALVEAIVDWAGIYGAGIGNGRRIVAVAAVRAELVRTGAIVLLVAAMGILLLGQHLGEPRPPDATVSLTTGLTLASYCAGVALLGVDALLELRARHRLDTELRSHFEALEAATVDDTEEDNDGV